MLHTNLTFQNGYPANALNFQAVDPSSTTFIAFAPDLKPAYYYHWSFGVQQQVSQLAALLDQVQRFPRTHTQLPYHFLGKRDGERPALLAQLYRSDHEYLLVARYATKVTPSTY